MEALRADREAGFYLRHLQPQSKIWLPPKSSRFALTTKRRWKHTAKKTERRSAWTAFLVVSTKATKSFLLRKLLTKRESSWPFSTENVRSSMTLRPLCRPASTITQKSWIPWLRGTKHSSRNSSRRLKALSAGWKHNISTRMSSSWSLSSNT